MAIKEQTQQKKKHMKPKGDRISQNSKPDMKAKKKIAKPSCQLNPTRLFVCGLAQGVIKSNLQELFPKAGSASIPRKSKRTGGTSYGFVQFSTPADAKAAFNAAQDLTIDNHKIKVLFAKMTNTKPEVQKKKAEKRKAKTEEKELKKAKTGDEKETVEETEEEKEILAAKMEKIKARKAARKAAKKELKKESKKETAKESVEETEEEKEIFRAAKMEKIKARKAARKAAKKKSLKSRQLLKEKKLQK